MVRHPASSDEDIFTHIRDVLPGYGQSLQIIYSKEKSCDHISHPVDYITLLLCAYMDLLVNVMFGAEDGGLS